MGGTKRLIERQEHQRAACGQVSTNSFGHPSQRQVPHTALDSTVVGAVKRASLCRFFPG
jgi:hypothetical protein